ncbi:hypothetical protein LPW11_11415 [Geomonas sp. RF6]|uniref:hypothetical protein n=1 Tax=Geomonas sp. RF6 TaxID=2897342 RepID=UPI001E584874|nr:hypothetical protein [Geomonas sp. RF6]UFS68528.1 hypothetical protein LPW11_11415 [Geomonas sp. RF6]
MESEATRRIPKEKQPGSSYLKAIDIMLRCWHIAVMGVLFGGMFWGVPFAGLVVWHVLTIVSGACLVAHGMYKSRHWLYQGNGVMAECHVALLALVHLSKTVAVPVLFLVVIFGVVGSHMPGKLRHYSFVHKRRID